MKTIKNLKAEEIRKSILQLAIQGKLVKQDPNDEPASELVKRIYAEKQRLIKEGKIKKDKNESFIFKGDDNCYYEKIGNNAPVKLEDLPFDIPDNWIWCNAKAILRIVVGATPSTSNHNYWDGDICWLPSGCCQDCEVTENYPKRKYITKLGYESCSTTMMAPNTVLIALTGATAGKVGLLKFDACANQSVVGASQYYGINPEFLFFQFMGRRKEILSDCIGSAQPHISKDYIEKMYLAIPPLEEQSRIVDKIKSCEKLINKYSVAEERLSTLEEEFPEKLKKSILQYAIEGKLVKQDPNDEPASVLLERIKTEKEKLIKEGKIKRDKNESYIYQGDDKNYYENLPSGWAICSLSNISSNITKGTTPRGGNVAYLTSGIGFLRAENIAGYNRIDKSDLKYIDEDTHNGYLKRSIIKENDVLITIAGTLGRTALVKKDDLPLNANQAVSIVRIIDTEPINLKYIIYCLNAPRIQKELTQQKKITAIPNLTLEIISSCVLPIAPFNQQNKIVSKIDYLFSQINN